MSDTKTDAVREIIARAMFAHRCTIDVNTKPKECSEQYADAILSALAEQKYKILGREPTDKMSKAATWKFSPCSVGVNHVWREMWDAALFNGEKK